MKRTITTVFLLLFTTVLEAVNGVSLSQRTIGNGLESQSLNVLAKDSQGRLWVGSDVGLSIISNGTVTNIRDVASEGGLVMLGNVKSIVCHEEVLIACDDRILCYNPKKQQATTLRYDDVILQTDDILLNGNEATFYDAGTHSLYSFDLERHRCRLLDTFTDQDYNFRKILKGSAVSDSAFIYLADDALGLFSYDRNRATLTRIVTDLPIVAKATYIDKSNIIWVSVPSKGVKGYYINSNYEQIAQYSTANCDLPSNDITYITTLPNGNLLTAHSDVGVCVIDRSSLEMGSVSVNIIENLKNVTCTLVNNDDRETLYATSGYGLISIKRTFLGQIRHLYENVDGIISYDNYVSALEEPQGTVILGTIGNGLCRIDLLTHNRTVFDGTQDLSVISMCNFDGDNILIADTDEGLLLFNRKTQRVYRPDAYPGLSPLTHIGLANTKMVVSEYGDIFIFNAGSRHYVYHKATDTLREINLRSHEGMPIKLVEGVCITPYAVYATYRGSIVEINFTTLESNSIYLNKDKVIHNITSIAANSKGELFFTEPEGLHRFDPRSNFDEILVETWGNGRFMNVAVDGKDRIWFTTTNEYIQMYDLARRELLMYSVEDGVPSSRFMNSFAIYSQSGFILFPDADGIVSINTAGPLMYDTPPVKVTCVSAFTDKREITGSELENSLVEPFKLPTKFREFTMEFSANSFNPTYPHLITYNIYKENMLVRSVTTTNPVITLPRLDKGIYTVVIRQAYRKGLSDPQPILSFKIPKTFFSTVPGVVVALVVILLFGYSVARISSSVEKNRMEKAMASQDIKNREDKIAFLSNIAHELRTPLSLIYNPVKDFLQEKSVDGIDYERMERIFNQVNKMTVMVNMILDSSRADVNKADILIEEVNLNEWLNFLLEDYRIDCYGKGFSLKFLMDKSIETVSIDKRIVETGLSNMVNNAIKYSQSGTVITVITQKIGNMIRVSVKDQGRGFNCDPEELFKRYYRENSDNNIPGYGLGLPYARLQLSLIGGSMSAMNNSDGVGSTFYMEFPATLGSGVTPDAIPQQAPTPQAADAKISHETHQEGMAQDFDTKNMNVLFVCADDRELSSLTDYFREMFSKILTAHDGKEALGLLKSESIDLVVSDADMDQMNGFDLCRTIKSTIEISHIPVILFTSRRDKRNNSLGYKMGADAFIPKPYDSQQLYALMRSQLGGRFEIKRQYNFGFFSKMNPDQTFSVSDEEFIRNLNTAITENISDIYLSEDSIRKEMGLTRPVITNKMEALLGATLTGYLKRIRVSVAKEMLADTDSDYATIARNTGYSSVDEMDKAFKRETGKTIYSVRENQG